MKPQNFPEKLIWFCILGTYPLYFSGLLFPVNTLIAWILLINLLIKSFRAKDDLLEEDKDPTPWIIWLWIGSMSLMLVAIIVSLIDFGYDNREIIRSVLNWTRDWALFALLPLIGFCSTIRPQIIYRASCILCLQSLFIIPFCIGAYFLRIPPLLYSSPFERLTQNGKIYYNVLLYIQDFDSDGLRLSLFTPWAPALGLISGIYLIFALHESGRKWQAIGIISALAMLVLSASRGSLLFVPVVLFVVWGLPYLLRPLGQIYASIVCFIVGIFSVQVVDGVKDFRESFKDARKSSSQVREALERIAFERWRDAPIWGHGKQIKGPALLKGMPIGSHHTWFGLLFTQGVVGFLSFLVPSICTVLYLSFTKYQNQTKKVALSTFLLILFASMADNIEKLAYIYWSALIILGIALKDEQPK
jgi:hypothetical protein